ncbi:hypothetical protein [Neorhizobium sp. JUb45]|uniref:hypothetical protein n=1 Tax=unclassified Neorhizobium TaxID=2629175 RepID=UPI001045FCFC|nr:hypothetical protein [Neorhizobium sp. JUb45]TCR04052.1 hypothetical protein EDF70_102148 [Neorhizobium sp. JUb45]
MIDREREQNPLSPEGRALLARLSALAGEPGRRIFAAMDGARFENLAASLYRADIAHRPLYRHAGGDYAIVAGGPWLVDPSRPAQSALLEDFGVSGEGEADALSDEALAAQAALLSQKMLASLNAGDVSAGGMLAQSGAPHPESVIARLEALVHLADQRSAIVFWAGDETLTAESLFRHLRGLNRITIPRGTAADVFDGEKVEMAAAGGADDAAAEPVAARGPATETVIFRHADPNVMMQVFPVLDETQAWCLFGPAELIFFSPDPVWGGGVKRGRRPVATLLAGRGMLHLSPDMIAMIEDARMQASRLKVVAYLRDVHPATLDVADGEMMERVLSYETSGTRLGLASERAHMKWAYLMSITDGGCDGPEAENFFNDTAKHPDDAIDDLLVAFEKSSGGEWDDIWAGSAP